MRSRRRKSYRFYFLRERIIPYDFVENSRGQESKKKLNYNFGARVEKRSGPVRIFDNYELANNL